MSKWWIKLGDIRVNCAAQTEGDRMAVVRALVRLYSVHTWIEETEDEQDEGYLD